MGYCFSNMRLTRIENLRDMACSWTKSMGKEEEAVNILKAGIDANPSR